MQKVFIGLDAFYTYFLWDAEVCKLIDPKSERLELIEVPDELVEEYDALEKAMEHMRDRLREVYNEKDKISRSVQKTDAGSPE